MTHANFRIAKVTVEPCTKENLKALKEKRTKLKAKRQEIKKFAEGNLTLS